MGFVITRSICGIPCGVTLPVDNPTLSFRFIGPRLNCVGSAAETTPRSVAGALLVKIFNAGWLVCTFAFWRRTCGPFGTIHPFPLGFFDFHQHCVNRVLIRDKLLAGPEEKTYDASDGV